MKEVFTVKCGQRPTSVRVSLTLQFQLNAGEVGNQSSLTVVEIIWCQRKQEPAVFNDHPEKLRSNVVFFANWLLLSMVGQRGYLNA